MRRPAYIGANQRNKHSFGKKIDRRCRDHIFPCQQYRQANRLRRLREKLTEQTVCMRMAMAIMRVPRMRVRRTLLSEAVFPGRRATLCMRMRVRMGNQPGMCMLVRMTAACFRLSANQGRRTGVSTGCGQTFLQVLQGGVQCLDREHHGERRHRENPGKSGCNPLHCLSLLRSNNSPVEITFGRENRVITIAVRLRRDNQ